MNVSVVNRCGPTPSDLGPRWQGKSVATEGKRRVRNVRSRQHVAVDAAAVDAAAVEVDAASVGVAGLKWWVLKRQVLRRWLGR
jgi:hypothetical protein